MEKQEEIFYKKNMPDNYFEKIIPEHDMKFAFMRKSFMPNAVIAGNFFEYIKTTRFSSPFCVVSRSVAKNFEKQLKSKPFSGGVIIISGGEPTEELVQKLVKKCMPGKYDALVGIGGGSVLDLVKVIKKERNLPLIAVPSTPSSGSETTPYALLVNSKTKSKTLVRSVRLVPDVVVLDTSFLETIPLRQMGYFLFDILGHCVEGLVSKMHTKFSDIHAYAGINTISRAFDTFSYPYSKETLESFQTAGFLGGLTQGMASVGLAHSLAHYFGLKYNISHAKAVSIFLPEVVRINAKWVHDYVKLNDLRIYDDKKENDKMNYLSGKKRLLILFNRVEKLFGLKKEKIKVGKKFSVEDAITVIQKDFCAPYQSGKV